MAIDTSALQNQITKEIASKLPAGMNIPNVDVNSMLGQAQEALKSQLGSATSLLEKGVGSLTSSFPSAATQFFGQANPLTSQLSSLSSKLLGTKEVQDKIQSLASDSAAAISNPVAFITKPMNDVIKGIDTMSQGSGIKDLMSGMSSLDISNLSKSLGSAIGSSSDISKAINSISSELSGQFSSITSSISSMASSVISPVTSTLTSFAGSLTNGIKSTLGGIGGGLGSVLSPLNDVMKAGSELTNSVLGVLPDPLKNVVTSLGTAYVAQTASDLLGLKMGSLQNILEATNGLSSNMSGSLATRLLSLGDSSGYSGMIDRGTGMLTDGFGSSTNSSDLQALYKAAGSICSNVNYSGSYNFAWNKDLFDVVMGLASELGISDLVNQMLQCMQYADDRTTSVLRSSVGVTVSNGDVNMYQTLTNAIGKSNITNATTNAIILNSNMQDTPKNTKAFQEVLDDYGYTVEGLVVTDSLGEHKIISGDIVGLMSATNTTVIDNAISKNTRALIQGAMVSYAQVA